MIFWLEVCFIAILTSSSMASVLTLAFSHKWSFEQALDNALFVLTYWTSTKYRPFSHEICNTVLSLSSIASALILATSNNVRSTNFSDWQLLNWNYAKFFILISALWISLHDSKLFSLHVLEDDDSLKKYFKRICSITTATVIAHSIHIIAVNVYTGFVYVHFQLIVDRSFLFITIFKYLLNASIHLVWILI